MTVAELLVSSRQSALRKDWAAALEQRIQAHGADPMHADTAWVHDLKNARGEMHRDPRTPIAARLQTAHENFVRYFQQQLGELAPDVVERLSLADVRARVQAPAVKDGEEPIPIEETEAFVTLALEHGLESELTSSSELIASVKAKRLKRGRHEK